MQSFFRKYRRDLAVFGILLLLLLGSAVVLLCGRPSAGAAGLYVTVEHDGKRILEVPLDRDARYLIIDGTAREAEDASPETAKSALSDVEGADRQNSHEVNLLEIRDGTVRVTEANCQNQVCVHTTALTREAYDFPIVCLPHNLVITLTEISQAHPQYLPR